MALLTVEGIYRDGKVELTETAAGVGQAARVLVTFLPTGGVEAPSTRPAHADEAREAVVARIVADMERAIDLGGAALSKERGTL